MEIEQIKHDAIVKLDFSTSFILRLQSLITHYAENTPVNELTEVYKKMRNNEELTEWEKDYETLLILIQSLETAAKEQQLVEIVTLPDSVESVK